MNRTPDPPTADDDRRPAAAVDPEGRALVAALAEEAGRAVDDAGGGGGGGAPSEEELLDYLAGTLSPEAESRIARLAVAEPEVAARLVDLSDLLAAGRETAEPADADAPADLAVAAGWRDFERRRRAAGSSGRRPVSPWLAALAASFLTAVMAVGVFSTMDRREPAGLGVVASLRTLELDAGSRAGGLKVYELAAGEPVRLVLEPERCSGGYRAELFGPTPGERRRIEWRSTNEVGRLEPLLPGLAPGIYELQLSGCDPPRELATHRFGIARPDPAAAAEDAP